MNGQELAIPFDINSLHENLMLKILRKIGYYIKEFIKRTIDILGALCGLLIVAPLAILTLIENVKNKDYGPIFFSQERIGKDGKLFKMYKFRSMVMDAEEKLEKILKEDKDAAEEYAKYKKLQHDPRVTKWGDFLRRTSLDEFPQFLNVLKGEMSLVGPRPYLPREKEDMGTYYKYIVQHKPGVTGLWQINGRSEVTFNDRLDMDMQYHYRKSFKNDIKILLITALITLKRKGAV